MPLAPCNGAPVHAFTTGGGPFWGRRKRFRRSVAQWLEHRSPNSALAIPPNSIPCHLINVFGPETRSQACRPRQRRADEDAALRRPVPSPPTSKRIAAVDDSEIAEATWLAAFRRWPRESFILRQGARLVADSRRPRVVK